MMRLFKCPMCWDHPCVCGHESVRTAKLLEEYRREFPPHYVPPGEQWDFPSTKELRDHPDFFERKKWREDQKQKGE